MRGTRTHMSDTPTDDTDTSETTYPVDEHLPLNQGYTPDELGVLFPSENGYTFKKQTGGVMCRQLPPFSGVYISLGRPTLDQGYPDWLPFSDGVKSGDKHPVTTVEVTDLPERDYESLPEWVQERGHFYDWDEFMYWLDSDDVWWHWRVDLVEELRAYNYDPNGRMTEHTGRDMSKRWDNTEEIWAEINNVIDFTYTVIDATERPEEYMEAYPGACEGIHWVRITGAKTDDESHWANQMTGELAMLLYPNSD